VVVAFSNCPQTHNACNAFRLKPLRAVIYEYKAQYWPASIAPSLRSPTSSPAWPPLETGL